MIEIAEVCMQPSDSSVNREVRGFLEKQIVAGKERGVQVAAYLKGELVVDTWAGVADPATGRGVDGETLFPVFSTGKGIVATIIHLLAERGRLGYDEPIAKYWPEFAANGKGDVTVRHALSHTSGLPHLPTNLSYETFHDWDAVCRWLAAAPPESPAGRELVYHGLNYGWILGELARRVDGRPIAQQVREEICRPLGVEGIYFGLPAGLEGRMAIVEAPPAEKPKTPPGELSPWPACIAHAALWMNTADGRRACVPGANGIMNARSLARHYAALLPGGVDGVELLPASRINVATEFQRPLDHPEIVTRQGLGYVMGNTGSIFGNRTAAFGHQGYGGSRGFADPATGFAMGIARNRFHDEASPITIINEVVRVLGIN
jgi:CubicO group peptidase (beta-lactamase class C family)